MARDAATGTRIGDIAFELVSDPSLARELASLWPVMLGIGPKRLDLALRALADGDDSAELLLLVETLAADISAEIAAPQAAAEAAAARCAAQRLAERGRAAAASVLLALLVAEGVATDADFIALARAECGRGGPQEGVTILSVGAAFHPGSSLLAMGLLRCRTAAVKGTADLFQMVAAVLEADAWRVDAVAAAADLLIEAGEAAIALEIVEMGVAKSPGNTTLLGVAATLKLRAGRHQDAVDTASRILAVTPDAPGALAVLASARARMGSPAGAGMLLGALAQRPDAALAVVYLELAAAELATADPAYLDPARLEVVVRVAGIAGPQLAPTLRWALVLLLLRLAHAPLALRMLAMVGHPEHATTDPLPQPLDPALLALLHELFRFSGPLPDIAALSAADLASLLGWQARALIAGGREDQARLCFLFAAKLVPQDHAHRFNAGFASLAMGDVLSAGAWFRGMARVYEHDMARVAWPRVSGQAWPFAPLPDAALSAFEALRPVDRDWPLITVVTPSYNQACYVEETLRSVLNQRYPHLQYIVMDGGSTDGSVEVLERWRGSLDTLLSEPDRGQTHAINKGLAMARGEILTWINSDDMFAPGALHMAALAWMRTGADLIFGHCLPHREHGFNLANLPRVRQETFTECQLADIFGKWVKGDFFYQPEVLFTRAIYKKVGGTLQEALEYTMDYEFWLRCAAAGGVVEAIEWPVALFRQHDAQKTAALDACIIEQAAVRDTRVNFTPAGVHLDRIETRLRRSLAPRKPRVGIVSSRLGKIFSSSAAVELGAQRFEGWGPVELAECVEQLDRPDLVVKLIHLQKDIDELHRLRTGGYLGATIGWFWDNHHHVFLNHDVAAELDVALPGHAFAAGYLRGTECILGRHIPLCVTQWSPSQADRYFFRGGLDARRSDRLYGGFVRYAFAAKRNRLISRLLEEEFSAVGFLDEQEVASYFGRPAEDRFLEWMSFKSSICLPLHGDLSQRFFDALLCGQVPVAPTDIHDLDLIVPPELQRSLPVIRFESYDVASVHEAHARACAAFDAGGAAGVLRRHRFARDRHMLPAAVEHVLTAVREIAGREGGG